MTGGQKGLTFFAILSGLLWVILGAVGAEKAKTANFFGSDSDLATVVTLKAASGDSFMCMFISIVGLCVASAVREMLKPPAATAELPSTTTAALPVTEPAAAPVEVVEPSAASDAQPGEPVEPAKADQSSE